MKLSKDKLYYIAMPYSHDNGFVRQMRYEMTIYLSAKLIKDGYTLLEPIAQCHEKSSRYEMPTGYDFWKERDRLFISKCDELLVLCFKGWQESVGVKDEVEHARLLGIPVQFIDPYESLKEELDALY